MYIRQGTKTVCPSTTWPRTPEDDVNMYKFNVMS